MKYRHLQIRLTDKVSDVINSLGWDGAIQHSTHGALIAAYLRLTLTSEYKTGDIDHYTCTQTINCSSPEEAFYLTNTQDGYKGAMNVGDILEDEMGGLVICQSFGFKEIKL